MIPNATIQRADKLIAEIEVRLERLRALLGKEAGYEVSDMGDRVLGNVLEQGAAVTRQELYEIAARHGMDRRGLGGFFRETGKKSLMELPGTGRIVLTPYGPERARRVLDRRETTGYRVYEPSLQRLAETSFAQDWDSPEDQIYDRA